jgi:hypothetical protein
MVQNEKDVVVLPLEDWQKKMIKDILGVDCNSFSIPVDDGFNLLYAPPFLDEKITQHRMYFTEQQMKKLSDKGITCDFIELTKEASHYMYGPAFE